MSRRTHDTDQRDSGLHKVLSLSWAYDAFQALVGYRNSYDIIVSEYIGDVSHSRILDIGCGTAEISKWFDDVVYEGFDPSSEYVASAQTHLRGASRVWQGSIEDPRLGSEGYGVILGLGVLHHVNDAVGQRFFDLASQHLSPGGRIITVDPCRYTGQSRLARALVSLDRGRWVREPQEYKALAHSRFETVVLSLRDDLLRIPYSHAIMQISS